MRVCCPARPFHAPLHHAAARPAKRTLPARLLASPRMLLRQHTHARAGSGGPKVPNAARTSCVRCPEGQVKVDSQGRVCRLEDSEAKCRDELAACKTPVRARLPHSSCTRVASYSLSIHNQAAAARPHLTL